MRLKVVLKVLSTVEAVNRGRRELWDLACVKFVLKPFIKVRTHRNQWKQWIPPKSLIQREKGGNHLKHRALSLFKNVLLTFLNLLCTANSYRDLKFSMGCTVRPGPQPFLC